MFQKPRSREKAAATIVPLPPVRNSLDHNIDDPEKPTSIYLFRENYSADNRVSWVALFRGPASVKFSLALAAARVENEAEIHAPLGKFDLQLKLKKDRVSAQIDLGHHLLAADKAKGLFFNPYALVEIDRVCERKLVGVGCMVTRDTRYKNNLRLNLRQDHRGTAWDFNSNTTLRKRGFFVGSLVNFTYRNGLSFNSRRFVFGYDRHCLNVNAEIGFGRGGLREWPAELRTLSAAYDLRELGLFGLLLSAGPGEGQTRRNSLFYAQGLQSFNGLDQLPPPAEHPVKELVGRLGRNFAFGYRNTLNRNLELKTKFSLKGPNALFLNYRLKENLHLQTTFQTLVAGEASKGFLEMPFEFGAKLRMET